MPDRTRHPRRIALLGIVAILATACSAGTAGAPLADVGAGGLAAADDRTTTAGSPPAAVGTPSPDAPAAPVARPAPAPSTTPVSVPDEVELEPPDLLVHGDDASGSAFYAAFGVEGVSHVAGVSTFDTLLVGDDGVGHPVRAVAVDPATFRPMTPAVTAQEPGVWQRLAEGDVVVRHDVAHQLGLTLGGAVELHGSGTQLPVRIGAFASNGAPPIADVVVPWDVGSRVGEGDVDTLVVSLADGVDPAAAGEAIVAAVGGGEVEIRQAPETQQARIVEARGRTTFEAFRYTSLGDGMIAIDPAWVRRWIVSVDLPGLGRTRCHRVMVPQLMAALAEIEQAGLYGHLKPEQFAGCWVPRHIDWSPDRPLSMHAWGLAIDFNARDNWLGQPPRMDRRIVAIFERWGFEWGGHWSRPDGMHFELDRVVEVG